MGVHRTDITTYIRVQDEITFSEKKLFMIIMC